LLNEKFWTIEKKILQLMDWRLNEFLPYDFTEVFLKLGIMFDDDVFMSGKNES